MSNKKDIDYLLSLLPNPKTESWKYTNIKRYLPEDFIINDKKRYSNLENIEVNKNLISTSPSYRVWFKNDKFDEQQSSVSNRSSLRWEEKLFRENYLQSTAPIATTLLLFVLP